VRALKVLLRVVQSRPLSGSVDQTGSEEITLDHHLFGASDEELANFARKRMQTLYHPTSTARMAKLEAGGVVNGELKVYGIEGLRVVDASIFPT
jgi:choline dehydrogenase